MEKNKNIFIAALLFIIIWLGMELWRKPETPSRETTSTQSNAVMPAPAPVVCPPCEKKVSREEALLLTKDQRIAINTQYLQGSILLKGLRMDDVALRAYPAQTEGDAPVVILAPLETPQAYYGTFRWENMKEEKNIELPSEDTVWSCDETSFTEEKPITLYWTNNVGIRFEYILSVTGYMITVKQNISNGTSEPIHVRAVDVLHKSCPEKSQGMIFHEGAIGVFQNKLREVTYEKCYKPQEQNPQFLHGDEKYHGWIGITDKYWLSAFIPEEKSTMGRFYGASGERAFCSAETFSPVQVVAPGATKTITSNFFVGPKNLKLLEGYKKEYHIAHFDLAVDFGWFYFLTKPFFLMLSFLKELLGSFSLAILIMTVLIRVLFLPLSIKSQKSMIRLKKLQPKIDALKAQYASDKLRLNQELLGLYKKEGINPVSGCLPMLIQLPFFFALYKVLFISLEMRHAPFWGWIRDLSAPDPSNIFTGFGLFSYEVPFGLHMGAWPIIMGLSMWLQQKTTDSPLMDPHQRFLLTYVLPAVFAYMFENFPVGLVIYWTWGNILTIVQQWVMTKWMGKGSQSFSLSP